MGGQVEGGTVPLLGYLEAGRGSCKLVTIGSLH